MRKFIFKVATLSLLGLMALPALAGDGWEKGSPYNQMFDPKSIVTVSGKITKIDRDNHPLKGMGAGFAAVMKTNKGEDVTIQVGPHWFTSYYKQKWDVKVGDSVEVTGSSVKIDGKPVIMVVQGRKGTMAMTIRSKKTGAPVWDLQIEDF